MRFTKAFQMIALVLAVSVFQVYVMAGPINRSTDPRTKDTTSASTINEMTAPATSNDVSVTTVSSDSQLLKSNAAAERMPLTAGSSRVLSRIFSKSDLQSRAAGSSAFLNGKTSAAEAFKIPGKRFATLEETEDSDSGGGGSQGTWIAVAVIAAVLTIAVIGLRADRNR